MKNILSVVAPLLLSLAVFGGGAQAASAADGQSAFDLVCSGTKTAFDSSTGNPDERRYTLDLRSKRWCRTDECAEALPIERVTPDEITLTRSEPGASVEHRHFISRISGEYVETVFMQAVSSGSRATGRCRRAAFSGFPKAKF